MGATITTARKNPVEIKCAMLVRVTTVFPNPRSNQSIVAGLVHWKLTARFW
jgi:hypothetical protein